MLLRFFIFILLIVNTAFSQDIQVGASRIEEYLPKLQGKNIAIVCNHSSLIDTTHLVDSLLTYKVSIGVIFAPEHGFRGDADAGAHVKSGKDVKTGIPIMSLYGKNKKPNPKDLQGIDIIVFDIQDVGTRFYTYISTLQYVMEACSENSIPLLILDRPNPNGHYVDGPVLEKKYTSFVGMQSIPIVYGMTIGEYATMLKGEKWITMPKPLEQEVITCLYYSHQSKVKLSVPPSPNLKSNLAIALYPSLCLFEGTNVSVGRGTDRPFEMYGSPDIVFKNFPFSFIPQSKPGAQSPPFLNKRCQGEDLSKIAVPFQFSLKYIILAYQNWIGNKDSFFLKNLFFDKLAGNDKLRKQIIKKLSEEEIRKSWKSDLDKFKRIRKKYLLYEDFE